MENGYRQLVILRDGGTGEGQLILGDVNELADLLRYEEHGDYSITEVYGLSQLNELKQVTWKSAQSEYDDNDWASVTVTVVFPDGAREQAGYPVDGRA